MPCQSDLSWTPGWELVMAVGQTIVPQLFVCGWYRLDFLREAVQNLQDSDDYLPKTNEYFQHPCLRSLKYWWPQ